jgi:hypothetical protein
MKTTNTHTMNFKKSFDQEMAANIYTAITTNNTFELYRERVYTSRGSSCTGDWLIQMNGIIKGSCSTLREAKTTAELQEILSAF